MKGINNVDLKCAVGNVDRRNVAWNAGRQVVVSTIVKASRRCEECGWDKGFYNPLRYCAECMSVLNKLEANKILKGGKV